jgi:hypothetical protein
MSDVNLLGENMNRYIKKRNTEALSDDGKEAGM